MSGALRANAGAGPRAWIGDRVRRARVLLDRYGAIRRERALFRRGWYDPTARSSDRAIFIGGCGRSGTTLLRELLARHPNVACGPETSMFGLPFDVDNLAAPWAIDRALLEARMAEATHLVEFADRFYREHLLAVEGKPRWADKTPNNVRAIGQLLAWYPEGRFVHIVRDGRDVVCSLRHHPREVWIDGRLTPVQRDNPIDRCATRWYRDTAAGLALRGHPRYLEVRYEDLVHEPERELRRLCDFLDEPFAAEMLTGSSEPAGSLEESRLANNPNAAGPIRSSSIGRWVRDLRPEERPVFLGIAGELLVALGYVEDHAWAERPLEAPAAGA